MCSEKDCQIFRGMISACDSCERSRAREAAALQGENGPPGHGRPA